MTAVITLAAAGLLNLLLLLLVAGVICAVVYFVFRLFAPHPWPAVVAGVVFLILLISALGGG